MARSIILEYGELWFAQNLDARLLKIDFIKGNRKPVAKLEADKTIGGAPLAVQFSAASSFDYDKDPIQFQWYINGEKQESSASNLAYTFEQEGIQRVRVEVRDEEGLRSSAEQEIQVGNEPTNSCLDIKGQSKFFLGQPTAFL